jgi:phosphoenolpyruvate synthase/pyruvate phosphate dikinase
LSMIHACGADEVILRSSTNAEDISGFTGAGLYESVHVKVAGLDDAQLSTAIKTVWASVWLPRAFLERLNFGIDNDKVAMCVLVQPFYRNETIAANGVAITVNPLSAAKYGVFVTAFAGGDHRATDSVTGVHAGSFFVIKK